MASTCMDSRLEIFEKEISQFAKVNTEMHHVREKFDSEIQSLKERMMEVKDLLTLVYQNDQQKERRKASIEQSEAHGGVGKLRMRQKLSKEGKRYRKDLMGGWVTQKSLKEVSSHLKDERKVWAV